MYSRRHSDSIHFHSFDVLRGNGIVSKRKVNGMGLKKGLSFLEIIHLREKYLTSCLRLGRCKIMNARVIVL